MLKKALLAATCAAAFLAPAHAAVNDIGFESGTVSSAWLLPANLQAVGSATVDYLVDPVTGDSCHCLNNITPVEGAYFGLLAPNYPTNSGTPGVVGTAGTTLLNYTTTGLDAGYVFLRLITDDYFWTPGINDSVTVTFNGATTTSYTLNSSDMASPDSGWQRFALPSGTDSMVVQLNDQYDSVNNIPTLAIDFSTSAIPEPTSVAMMLAGLGALGLKRRRSSKAE